MSVFIFSVMCSTLACGVKTWVERSRGQQPALHTPSRSLRLSGRAYSGLANRWG